AQRDGEQTTPVQTWRFEQADSLIGWCREHTLTFRTSTVIRGREGPMADESAVATEPVVEEPVVEEKKEHQVPVSVLTSEREKFYAREDQLRAHIDKLQGELNERKSAVRDKVEDAPTDEEKRTEAYWKKRWGINEMENQIKAQQAKLDELG